MPRPAAERRADGADGQDELAYVAERHLTVGRDIEHRIGNG